MTPRLDIVSLHLGGSPELVRATIREHSHSRYPVIGPDNEPVGFLRTKDLIDRLIANEPLDLAALVQKPLYVPDSLTLMQLLETFRRHRQHVALVVDEYGETQGLVTLNDVLLALVGDIGTPEEDTDPDVVRRDDGSWLIDGNVTIGRFKEATGAMEQLPDEGEGRYNTLSGLAMEMLRHIPQVGNRFETAELKFEIVDMDGHRVDRLLVTRKATPSDNEASRPTASS
jgi:putative hemolysin